MWPHDDASDIIARIDPSTHVLLAGPTASGKSALAMAIARAQGGAIVNADALQVHARWRILTARPGPEALARAPHHLYGHLGDGAAYSVGHWLREVAGLLDTGQRLILTGGTGLYFTALTQGLAEVPPVPDAVRDRAQALIGRGGIAALLAELDAPTRARIETANPARVMRAWEVLQATGRGLASWQAQTPPPLVRLSRVNALVIRPSAGWLNARIDARLEAMLREGVLDEVRAALPVWSPARPWARAIGAAAFVAHLRGEIGLDAAMQAARIASHRYGKRQRSWFRNRMADWQQIVPG